MAGGGGLARAGARQAGGTNSLITGGKYWNHKMLLSCTTKPDLHFYIKSVLLNHKPMWSGRSTVLHVMNKYGSGGQSSIPRRGDTCAAGTGSRAPWVSLPSKNKNIWLPSHYKIGGKLSETEVTFYLPHLTDQHTVHMICLNGGRSEDFHQYGIKTLLSFPSFWEWNPSAELHNSVWVRPSGLRKAAKDQLCNSKAPFDSFHPHSRDGYK